MQVDVIHTDVTIRNLNVPATLSLPEDKSQIRAGIVYVHGSGEGHESEVAIEARRFASKGIAFLTVAKVMVGYSRTKRDYLALARDAAEALEWLRGHPDLLDLPIGLMGFSEGGWVAPITAAARPDIVDFLVLESGAIVTPGAQIRYHRAAETRSLPLYRRFLARLYTEFAVLMCDYSRFNLLPHLARISQPIYAVWGVNDHTIPIEQARSLLEEHASIQPHIEMIEREPHYLNPEGEWLVKIADWILALPRNQHRE